MKVSLQTLIDVKVWSGYRKKYFLFDIAKTVFYF